MTGLGFRQRSYAIEDESLKRLSYNRNRLKRGLRDHLIGFTSKLADAARSNKCRHQNMLVGQFYYLSSITGSENDLIISLTFRVGWLPPAH